MEGHFKEHGIAQNDVHGTSPHDDASCRNPGLRNRSSGRNSKGTMHA